MSLDAYAEGIDEGLEIAAKILEATAGDYAQMAQQAERGIGRLHGREFSTRKALADGYHEKAQLLRGQAGLIRSRK